MKIQCLVLILALCAILHFSGAAFTCSDYPDSSHQVRFSVSSKRNKTGEWRTSFSADNSGINQPEQVDVDVVRKYTVCQGNHVFSIAGVIKESLLDSSPNQTASPGGLFFKKSSSDAAISNNWRTLERLLPDGRGSALTNRPLMDDEIFTVRLDKKGSKNKNLLGIGVTTHSPETLDVPSHMYFMQSGVWMFYQDHLYKNGQIINKNYAKMDVKNLQVGQKVGVMRSRFGNLHLFLDGVDQGPAVSNIPKPVWGAFDLHDDAWKATIVDS